MSAVQGARYGLNALLALTQPESPWRGLVSLVVSNLQPMVSFLQMVIGQLLVKAILHYTKQDILGVIITTPLSLVGDAIVRYNTPVMAV